MAEHYYTIKDIEEMTGIPATAIRFYDKRGLLVFVKRSPNGMRIFTDRDVEKIRLIQLLRNLDMPVNVISRYIGLVQQGDASRPERRRMIASHIAELEDHLHALQEAVEAAKCVETALVDKDAVLPPRKILGYLRNWSIFSPESRPPSLFFIPLVPYPARSARHLPHAGKALSVGIVFPHMHVFVLTMREKRYPRFAAFPIGEGGPRSGG
uniref:MerR family transcriptional regulator n=1 Tax=Dialister sp. TaxID=1955814 RepID=UPI004028F12E